MTQDLELDLSDVVLDGLVLVPDDPTAWVVPNALMSADDIMSWWDTIVFNDEARAAIGLTDELRDTLLWLAGMFEQLVAENDNRPPHQSKVRSVVRHVCHLGLTTQQASVLLNVTQNHVVRALYCNREMYPSDVTSRLEAEASLRDGVSIPDVARSCALTVAQVKSLADMLGIEPSTNHYSKPIEARNAAIEMRRGGMANREISKALAAEGHKVSPATISQWWRRYGNENGGEA
jgi:hypothetical protein